MTDLFQQNRFGEMKMSDAIPRRPANNREKTADPTGFEECRITREVAAVTDNDHLTDKVTI